MVPTRSPLSPSLRRMPTSLNFAGSSTDRVGVGSGASLDNLVTATYLAWQRTGASGGHAMCGKGPGGGDYSVYKMFNVVGGLLAIEVEWTRATTSLRIRSNNSELATNTWYCLAGVADSGGVDGDQKLYKGTLATPLAEIGSYLIQRVGTGAVGDDSAHNLSIGNLGDRKSVV